MVISKKDDIYNLLLFIGDPRRSESERRIYKDGGPLRAGAWRLEQQQLRQRRADCGHRCEDASAGEVMASEVR